METINDKFESMPITDLIGIEKWLYEYKHKEFKGHESTFLTDDEKVRLADIKQKIKDVEEAILIRITDMQDKSFGGDIKDL